MLIAIFTVFNFNILYMSNPKLIHTIYTHSYTHIIIYINMCVCVYKDERERQRHRQRTREKRESHPDASLIPVSILVE